ncbi:MAG TPA: divalent-cation tolerance protein CutA [Kiritimatiellia bacterium]|nr:divalent-cation tolerance protein CutA [Kiritimatiellia bacterium]
MVDQVMMVYVTASSANEAEALATTMVSARLAACANLLGTIESVYWWEGKVERGGEVALLFKTTASRLTELTEAIKRQHSYTTPCVVAWRIDEGNPDFLNWVREETGLGSL